MRRLGRLLLLPLQLGWQLFTNPLGLDWIEALREELADPGCPLDQARVQEVLDSGDQRQARWLIQELQRRRHPELFSAVPTI